MDTTLPDPLLPLPFSLTCLGQAMITPVPLHGILDPIKLLSQVTAGRNQGVYLSILPVCLVQVIDRLMNP